MQLANTDDEINRCFPAMLILRPHLVLEEFVAQVRRQEAQGYCLAYIEADGEPVSVAGFRIVEHLSWGKTLYIDDLITVPEARGRGYGGKLLDELIAEARSAQCVAVHLDSGYQGSDAHRLYLNHGFKITAHHFALQLSDL